MPAKRGLSPEQKAAAKNATLINAKMTDDGPVFNVPGGQLFWALRLFNKDHLSPEAAVAKQLGVQLAFAFEEVSDSNKWLCSGGPDRWEHTVLLNEISAEIARWLGYQGAGSYWRACRENPAEVLRRLKDAK